MLGLIDDVRWRTFEDKYTNIENEKKRLKNVWIQPYDNQAMEVLGQKLEHEYCLFELLKRPEINYQILSKIESAKPFLNNKTIIDSVETQIKYEGYIKRQLDEIKKYRKNEQTLLPKNINYDLIKSLSNEAKQKLKKYKPTTIGQASRIEGITPAAISILLIYIK
jgi:tRNA uridine 5-carboxymethylaminomethyl modification enzyme